MITGTDIARLKQEARRILIEHGNGMVYAAAMGQDDFTQLCKEQMRVHYIYDTIKECYSTLSDPEPPDPELLPLVLTWEDINVTPVTDPYSLEAWNNYFDLPAYGNPFQSITVEGNVVRLYGGSGITIKEGIFSNSAYPVESPQTLNGFLLSIVDLADCVVATGEYSFAYLPNVEEIESKLTEVILPVLENVYEWSFAYNKALVTLEAPKTKRIWDYGFFNCIGVPYFDMDELVRVDDYGLAETRGVETYYFPLLITAGNYAMMNMYSSMCKTINLPVCTSVGDGCFAGNWSIEYIYLQSILTLGSSATNGVYQDVFSNEEDDILVDGYVPQYPLVLSGSNGVS